MPDSKIRWDMETLRTFSSASLTGSYQNFGTPTVNKAVGFRITNNGTTDVTISNNSTNDKLFVPAGSFVLIDVAANCESDDESFLPAQTQWAIKGTAGTGTIYLESYFQF